MIQYLLNCSAIWLLSLIGYDLFLRKTTFHSYNRLYLIGTLLAGVLIPLFSFVQKANFSQQTKEVYGLDKTFTLKSNIVSAAQINSNQSINWEAILWAIYALGVITSLCFLLADVAKTIRLYRRGDKTTMEGLWLINTGKNHNPFSFFGFIFISDANIYSPEQISMILAHEKRHNTLWHGIDLLLMQLCKIIFWFQPLVYIYLQRLRMVHEYQADKAVAKPLAEYGNFLLEQSIFTPTPQLAHSFYYSPLKNRILMFTRKSSTWSKSKSLLIIPVLGIAMMCFSKDAFSDNKRVVNGNKVTYKGNTFEMSLPQNDSVYMDNPETGKQEMQVVTFLPYPIKMNGEKLYQRRDVDEVPVVRGVIGMEGLLSGVLGENRALLEKLDDGDYLVRVLQTVVGKNGELLYYYWPGITHTLIDKPVTPQNVKQEFDNNLNNFIEKMKFYPAQKAGKAVLYGESFIYPLIVVVKNHKVTIRED